MRWGIVFAQRITMSPIASPAPTKNGRAAGTNRGSAAVGMCPARQETAEAVTTNRIWRGQDKTPPFLTAA